MRNMTEEDDIEVLAEALQREFSDVAPTICDLQHEVRDAHDRYRDAHVREFISVLVYRETRAMLRQRRATSSLPTSAP